MKKSGETTYRKLVDTPARNIDTKSKVALEIQRFQNTCLSVWREKLDRDSLGRILFALNNANIPFGHVSTLSFSNSNLIYSCVRDKYNL